MTTEANGTHDLLEQLRLFLPVFAPRSEAVVIELRALGIPGWKPDVKPAAQSGFFDLSDAPGREALLKAIEAYTSLPPDKQPEGVYVTINPVDRVFLARANNRMGNRGDKISASDEHIIRRRWLAIDLDPTRRIAGISATDDEKAEARKVAEKVREDMRARGFAEPMFCDSGNGFHLWYRIDLPTDDDKFVEHTLKGLARRHNTAGATVDTSLFNPSRILKIPGTWARKGSETAERPHRMAHVIDIPKELSQCA